jgi:hypothetical protein
MKSVFYFLLIFLVFPLLSTAETLSLRTPEVEILFSSSQKNIAQEVATLYPVVSNELEKDFQWEIDFSPAVVLAETRDEFRKAVGSDIILAFAVPGRNLIVLDTSRVYTEPFTLKTTLKHEVCHLLLHRHIDPENLPRWLDEGVCQWASGGISELMADLEGRGLSKAVISERLIDMRALERFPMDERNLSLAYEESKSFIEFIDNKFGRQGILGVLNSLKDGRSVDQAVRGALGTSLIEVESAWHADLKKKYTWISYLSYHIYTILFAFATLVMIYGFVRFIKRKKAYVDEEDEENISDKNLK